MADKIEIDVNVDAAKKALDDIENKAESTTQKIKTEADNSASATNRLTAALQNLAATTTASVTGAVEKLGASFRTIDGSSANTAADALSRLSGVEAGLSTDKLIKFTDVVKNVGPATTVAVNTAEEALKKLGGAFDTTNAQINANGMSTATATRLIRELGTEMINAAGFATGMGVTTGKLATNFNTLRNAGVSTTQMIQQLVVQLGTFGTVAALAAGAAVAFGAIYTAATRLLGPIVQVGRVFEDVRSTLISLDGQEAGTKTFDRLQAMAKGSVVEVTKLVGSFKDFREGSIGVGMSLETTLGIYQGFTTALTAAQATTQQSSKTMDTLNRMMLKGHVTVEELTTQFKGIPSVSNAIASALGTTTDGLRRMGQTGQLVAKDILPKLGAELQKLNAEGAALASGKLPAAAQSLANAWTNLMGVIAEGSLGGVLAGLAAGFNQLTTALESPALRVFASAMGDVVGLLSNAVLSTIGGVVQGFTFFADVLVRIGSAVGSFLSPIGDLLNRLTGTTSVMKLLSSTLSTTAAIVGALAGAIGLVILAKKAWVVATGAVTGALGLMSRAIGVAVAATNALKGALGGPFLAVLAAGLGFAIPLVYDLSKGLFGIGASADTATGGLGKITSAAQTVNTALNGMVKEAQQSPAAILALSNELFSFETAKKQATLAVEQGEEALKRMREGFKQSADAVRSANERDRAYIDSIKAQSIALDQRRQAVQRDAQARKDSASISSGLETERLTKALQDNKREMDSVNLSIADRTRREQAFTAEARKSADEIKRQIDVMKEYKVALSEAGVEQVKQFQALGVNKEKAVELAYAMDRLNETTDQRVAKMQAEAERGQQLINMLSQNVNRINEQTAAYKAEIAAGSTRSDLLKLLIARNDQAAASHNALLDKTTQMTAALRVQSLVEGGGISIRDAAIKVAQEMAQEKGANIDATKLETEVTKKLNDEVTKLAGGQTQAAAAGESMLTTLVNNVKALVTTSQGVDAANTAVAKSTKVIAEATPQWDKLTASFGKLKTDIDSVSTAIPVVTTNITTIGPALGIMNEALIAATPALTALRDTMSSVSTTLPVVATNMELMGTNAATAAEGLRQFTSVADGVTTTATAINTLVDNFTRMLGNLDTVQDKATSGITALDGLKKASEGTATGFRTTITAGSALIVNLDSIGTAVRTLIEEMNRLKTAAEDALAAASRARAGGGSSTGGPTVDVPSEREGGFSGSRYKTQSVDPAVFDNAPQFAKGTESTSKFMSTVAGGGIPSILHPHEAVVPLSGGRKIPVELDAQIANTSPVQKLDVRPIQAPLNRVAMNLTDVARAMYSVSTSVKEVAAMQPAELPVTQDKPDIQDIVTPRLVKALMSNVPAGGLGSSGGSTATGVMGGVGFDTSGGVVLSKYNDKATSPQKSKGTNLTLNVNIQTPDADSFRRTLDQTTKELADRIKRVVKDLD